jgi:tRNA (guanine-N7-)-methyltransferase
MAPIQMSETIHAKKLFGRRKGPALSARQKDLMGTLLPELALRLEPGRAAADYFENAFEVWLEIGFGAGEHLVAQAGLHPNIGMIGVEPYIAGIAKLLSKLNSLSPTGGEGRGEGAVSPQLKSSNIRLYTDDAREVIAALPDASLSRVFLLFPDPWPKTRHHKRRFVQMEMLDRLARVMRKGAEFRFATDDAGYLVWTLERLSAHPEFAWLARSPEGWRKRPADWPDTRYETKAIAAGRVCTYLRFRRR